MWSQPYLAPISDHGQSDEEFKFQLDDLRAGCSGSLFFSQNKQHIAERGSSFI